MRYVLISDLHSRSPERVLGEGDRVIALGDYDNPEVLERLLGIEGAVVCIGNHDHWLVTEWKYSQDYRRGLKKRGLPEFGSLEYLELMESWQKSFRAREYVEREARGQGDVAGLKTCDIAGRRIACVHSSLLRGECSERMPCSLWTKPINDYVIGENFRQMQKMRYWLLLRGHSHMASAISVDGNADLGKDRFSMNDCKMEFGRRFRLNEDRRYVISVGGFFEGEYAVLDDEALEIEFRRVT